MASAAAAAARSRARLGGPEAPPAELLGDRHRGDRGAHAGALAEALMEARGAGQAHRGAHQGGVRRARLGGHDGLLLGGRLVGQGEVLEAVPEGLREVARADVLDGVLGGHHLKAGGGPHGADVGHHEQALVERRQEHVLHALRHAVELVDEEHGAAPQGRHQGAGAKRRRAVALGHHEGRVEPAAELGLGVAVVAVDAQRLAAQVGADGQRHGGLADAHGALEQEVAARGEHGQGEGQLGLAADDAVLVLDLLDGGHDVILELRAAKVAAASLRGLGSLHTAPIRTYANLISRGRTPCQRSAHDFHAGGRLRTVSEGSLRAGYTIVKNPAS